MDRYYEIRYLGHVIDALFASSDDEARSFRDDFVRRLMRGEYPGYLDSGDFADHDDCRRQHKLYRANYNTTCTVPESEWI